MFRIGQRVVCVSASGNGIWAPGEALTEGAIYTIHSMFSHRNFENLVRLFEIKRHPACMVVFGHDGYGIERFRPVATRKTSIEIFQAMLTPSPVTVDAMKLSDHAREIVR